MENISYMLSNCWSTGIRSNFCIKWDDITPDTVPVCNYIKLGGILSPKLFNIYADVLSEQLNTVMVVCCLNDKDINHVYYMDNIVFISSSADGMQKLVHECGNYSPVYEMTLNKSKSHT